MQRWHGESDKTPPKNMDLVICFHTYSQTAQFLCGQTEKGGPKACAASEDGPSGSSSILKVSGPNISDRLLVLKRVGVAAPPAEGWLLLDSASRGSRACALDLLDCLGLVLIDVPKEVSNGRSCCISTEQAQNCTSTLHTGITQCCCNAKVYLSGSSRSPDRHQANTCAQSRRRRLRLSLAAVVPQYAA